jgi:RNA polymerase sigma-70 factor, ECF subfamily
MVSVPETQASALLDGLDGLDRPARTLAAGAGEGAGVPHGRGGAPGGEDAALMARVREGDREAFAELVDRHKDPLVGYLARLTGSPDRVQDLAQETFLRLYRAAGSYRERGQLAAFLYRIATNLVRSEARRERRWRLLAPRLGVSGRLGQLGRLGPFGSGDRAGGGGAVDGAHGVEAGDGPRRLLRRELQRRLAGALAALPLELRAPLVLYEIEEWSQRDIARALGCREGTVKSRLFRARHRLREELADCRDDWNDGGLS